MRLCSLPLWIGLAYFAVRGFLASLYDLNALILRKSGVDPTA
jgi:hypothetical protein